MTAQKHSARPPVQKESIASQLKGGLGLISLLFLSLSLVSTTNIYAAIYKCTDENGRKIFSGTPCTEGTKPLGTLGEARTPPVNNEKAGQKGNTKPARAEELPEGVVPVTITGRVTYANGNPIVGAEVLSWARQDKKTGFKGMVTDRTDASGSYRLNIDSRFLWVVYHHGTERREFSQKGPWQSDTAIDFIVPAE